MNEELFFTATRGRVTQDQWGEVKITFIVPMDEAKKALSVPIETLLRVAVLRETNG